MIKKIKKFFWVFFSIVLSSNTVIAAQSPTDVFDNAWASVCTNVQGSGSDLDVRCIENNLGGQVPGQLEPPLRGGSVAAAGSNGGIFSGVGNSTVLSDQYIQKSLKQSYKMYKPKGGAAGDILSTERLGFFASGMQAENDRQDTFLETGYDLDEIGFTVGMDYIFSENFVAGIAVSYSDTDLDFNSTAGSSNYEKVSVLTFANYNFNDHFSLDGYLGWSDIDFDLKRNISYPAAVGGGVAVNTSTSADAEANKVLAGLNLVYTLSYNALEISPLLRLDYSGTFIDGYTESGGSGLALQVESQNIQSFKSNIGFNTSYAVSVPWGIILPNVHASYVHEFLDQRRTIHASYIQDPGNFDLRFKTDQPDRDYFVFGAGLSTVLARGIQLFVDYERIEGHRYLNSYMVSGGLRAAF